MAARDKNRANAAIERLNEEGREPGLREVIWHELDLKDPRSEKESAEHFIARERKLDILGSSPRYPVVMSAADIHSS
ncbi:hypothetical protein EDD85DRAFT_867506, partial [Armillaria nabsnona]